MVRTLFILESENGIRFSFKGVTVSKPLLTLNFVVSLFFWLAPRWSPIRTDN